ncbi:pyridoxal-phosphate dependent enzyme domain-containing protein [Trichoderma breve]|uniref:Pyridoxal-phosphate dependent enzyme domain-containing protein n=1 Tax=Trichoderma breve TaxID=2034170 RepID=A0A9W9ECV5_9HYPO|nr:pyridoxal-phosphate dependent enzyme domain-containing protein [Trichoderma breve]KAJ4864369.1 pyridoxal-phosphate dependent enzyme domain-containing protein [Trichoderma breve]
MAPDDTADENASYRYLSTRGQDSGFSFEEVVLNSVAPDGGLYIPEEIPRAAAWESWGDLSFPELAFEIMSLYISPSEVPPADLKDIIARSYSSFRSPEVTPLVQLKENHYLLELFHGPTFASKDIASQFLGNLLEYFLVKKNKGKTSIAADRHHLTFAQISPVQEAQITTVPDENVCSLAVAGTFDDCQNILRRLQADRQANEDFDLVSSRNWAQILAQIVLYFYSYFSLVKKSASFKTGDKVRFVIPTGKFGSILAGYFALHMGLPVDKLVIATNENDILDRFWKTGRYEKQRVGRGGHGVKKTLSPAMDILTSYNFERLLWFLACEFASSAGMDNLWNQNQASQEVYQWFQDLDKKGFFGPVYRDVIRSARRDFESERVTDQQTIETIKAVYRKSGYVLDPHSAVGAAATQRSMNRTHASIPHISFSTAHPAKFSETVIRALHGEEGFSVVETSLTPAEFADLDKREKKITVVSNDWQKVREIINARNSN